MEALKKYFFRQVTARYLQFLNNLKALESSHSNFRNFEVTEFTNVDSQVKSFQFVNSYLVNY